MELIVFLAVFSYKGTPSYSLHETRELAEAARRQYAMHMWDYYHGADPDQVMPTDIDALADDLLDGLGEASCDIMEMAIERPRRPS